MYIKKWSEVRLLFLYFSPALSILHGESGATALRCHSCVSFKSDRLEDCGNWPSPNPVHERVAGQIIIERNNTEHKEKKVCVKVKVQAVDTSGQDISMAIRYAETPRHKHANRSQSSVGIDYDNNNNNNIGKCISAMDQKDVNFAMKYLQQQDNLSITIVQVCKCSNMDFCNGQDKIISKGSTINFLILASGLTLKFYNGLLV